MYGSKKHVAEIGQWGDVSCDWRDASPVRWDEKFIPICEKDPGSALFFTSKAYTFLKFDLHILMS